VLAVQTPVQWPKYAPTARRADFYRRVLGEVAALPGVTSAGFITWVPMTMTGGIWPVELLGTSRPNADPDASVTASVRYVTPGVFATLGIPILRGRDVLDADVEKSPFVVVVSESFANRYWPGQDPIGRQFKIAFFDRTVVGVVGNVRVRGLERRSEPQVYLPYQQIPDGSMSPYAPRELVVRAEGDVTALAPAIRRIVNTIDPELPVSRIRTMQDVIDAQTAGRSTQLQVLEAFAIVSLLLAGIGIHGLLAYGVAQRRSEIGLRMALGARTTEVARMVLGQGAVLGVSGAIVGVAIAYTTGRQMEALLAGVTPSDPATFAASAIVVVLTTVAGSLIPAIRAARVDAASVMRS
jgi:predicted permease